MVVQAAPAVLVAQGGRTFQMCLAETRASCPVPYEGIAELRNTWSVGKSVHGYVDATKIGKNPFELLNGIRRNWSDRYYEYPLQIVVGKFIRRDYDIDDSPMLVA
jgi:hypothetical protein